MKRWLCYRYSCPKCNTIMYHKYCYQLFSFTKAMYLFSLKSYFSNNTCMSNKIKRNKISHRYYFSWILAMTKSVPTPLYKNEDYKIFLMVTF